MANYLCSLPSIDLGFKNRLGAIEQIVKDGLATFQNGAIWSIDNVFVAGDIIVDRPAQGAFSLRRHIEWLKGHVATATPAAKARKVYTPIDLPPKSGSKAERLTAIEDVSDVDVDAGGSKVIKFDEGCVDFDRCRVVGDQIVTRWERGSGYRIETELEWLGKQIEWEERQARGPKQAKRSIHPSKWGLKATPWYASLDRMADKLEKATKPAAAPKPPMLSAGKATEIGKQALENKRLALRKQIEAQIEAAYENDDNAAFETLSSGLNSRVAEVVLTGDEILEINRKVEIEEREARRRDPNFGAQKPVAKAPKADKKAEGKNGKKGGKKRAA